MKTYQGHNYLLDLIRYPLVTDKTTRLFENNKYTFAIQRKATKNDIKLAIEYIFTVKVKAVNILNTPRKQRRVGKFIGYKPSLKKAIITLVKGDTINLFPDS
nr:ribosomal protein L23 [Cavernulicola chilensis]